MVVTLAHVVSVIPSLEKGRATFAAPHVGLREDVNTIPQLETPSPLRCETLWFLSYPSMKSVQTSEHAYHLTRNNFLNRASLQQKKASWKNKLQSLA